MEFGWDGEVLRWSLGPHREGRWALVLGEGVARYPVPPEGAFYLGARRARVLWVRYDGPTGRLTYSARLDIARARPERLVWTR